MGLIGDVLGKTFGGAINSAADAADKFIFTKEEQAKFDQLNLDREERIHRLDLETVEAQAQREFEYYKLDQVDRSNARELGKKELESNDTFVRRFRYWYASGLTLLIVGILAVIIFVPVRSNVKDILFIIIGSLTTILTQIVNYFFGSSQGSANKSQTIDKVITNDTLGKS